MIAYRTGMDAWEKDRRRSGGAGWVLDAHGDWVPTSAAPDVPDAVMQATPAAEPVRGKAARARGIFRAAMTVFVIPALAAAATLYVWKGPGGDIVLAQIEPLMAAVRDVRATQAEAPATGASAIASSTRPTPRSVAQPWVEDQDFETHALPALPDCVAVRRGMGNGIVFHQTGGCPD